MRTLFAIALIASGFTGVTAVRAADLPAGRLGNYSEDQFEYGRRAEMLVLYDNQPGVLVRSYWAAPWQGRHYFPATGKMPKVGRAENLNVPRARVQPAKTFSRHWSNDAAIERAFEHDQPVIMQAPLPQPSPHMDDLPPQYPKP